MTTQEQIERIKMIMGHPSMKTCLDCSKVYLPMSEITLHLCPFCEADKIEEVKAGILKVEIEQVSNDNDDLLLFDNDMPEEQRKERSDKAKIGGRKATISKRMTKTL